MYRIFKPTLFIDLKRVVKNLERMLEKAEKSNVKFRPHFKTHQSLMIGNIFRKYGVKAITVSSLDMALYFAKDGWDDITVAFPVNIIEIDKINFLASKIELNLLFDSIDAVNIISKNLKGNVNGYIKIDTGYNRAGVYYKDLTKIKKIVRQLIKQNKIKFKGLLSHFGHTYYSKNNSEIKETYHTSVEILNDIKSKLKDIHSNIEISIGDTPSCSLINDFSGVDEIRPGNFIFYDYKMLSLNVCREEDIAVAVACPVISIYEDRKEILVYCGAIHLSKDSIKINGKELYGIPVISCKNGWGKIEKGNFVKSLSQEHGLLKVTEKFIRNVKIGDIIFIIPIHSCLTADALKSYVSLDGKLIDHM
ncbi:MAG: alanine racemase [Ignavibacteria bacterium]|nr:alanine racemase [Ignavibacteria bacterium]